MALSPLLDVFVTPLLKLNIITTANRAPLSPLFSRAFRIESVWVCVAAAACVCLWLKDLFLCVDVLPPFVLPEPVGICECMCAVVCDAFVSV